MKHSAIPKVASDVRICITRRMSTDNSLHTSSFYVKKKMDHYVEAVLDSTRYFVARVKDEKANREALIGLGFRDREEAGDFRAALSKYEQDISKERANR